MITRDDFTRLLSHIDLISTKHFKKYANTINRYQHQFKLDTIQYHNLPLIVSKFLTSTGIGSKTKTTTQQLSNEKISCHFRAKN